MVRWIRYALCSLAAGTAACAEPTRPMSPVGMWTLVSVDGAALPAAIITDVAIVSGTLELRVDGTYEELTGARLAGTLTQTRVSGEWRESAGIVELLDRIAGLPFAGRWSASSLEVQGERAMKYGR